MWTVIDLLLQMGIAPEAPLSWEIGAIVREAYRAQYGRLPDKRLRVKTCGKGSHCFAVYPDEFLAVAAPLVARVLLVRRPADAQLRLWTSEGYD